MRLELALEEIPFGFGEEEKVLEIDCESVFDTGRNAIGFVPNDRVSQRPTTIDHFNGETERHQHEGLLRHCGLWPLCSSRIRVSQFVGPTFPWVPALVESFVPHPATSVGVGEIDPATTCGFENASYFIEDITKLLN